MAPRLGLLPPQQKAAWLWYFPQAWQRLIDNLAHSGHNIVMPKGGIDDMGDGVPSLWQQWEPARLDYARSVGVEPYLFVYSWLGRQFGVEAETNAIVQLCRRWLPRRIVVNAEVETDNMTDGEVGNFFDTLEAKLLAAFGDQAPAVDNSSVPSWDGGKYGGSIWHNVNYEAISARTAVDWYQNYWDAADVAGGMDWQDGYQRKRQASHASKVVVPSWIVGKDVGAFADWADGRGYTGIAGWESGNVAYRFADVANAFPHLSHQLDLVQESVDPLGEAPKAAKVWNEFTNVKLFNARILGLPKREGLVDLSGYQLDPHARFLRAEKGVIWSDGQQVDYLHLGQYADLQAAGKVIEY